MLNEGPGTIPIVIPTESDLKLTNKDISGDLNPGMPTLGGLFQDLPDVDPEISYPGSNPRYIAGSIIQFEPKLLGSGYPPERTVRYGRASLNHL